ncbi:hypothetical protein BH23GEM3_BH23GEM3_07120 [soil metagenome]|nr:hypothetical protein [Gemmatimonadota bacterium]
MANEKRSEPQDQAGQTRSTSEETPPPGAGVINNSRSGQGVADNPVIRARRDAGDKLADRVREEGPDDPVKAL